MEINNSKEVYKIVKNFKKYVDYNDEKQHSLVDAVIISNLNLKDKRISVSSFDFNLNCKETIKDISNIL